MVDFPFGFLCFALLTFYRLNVLLEVRSVCTFPLIKVPFKCIQIFFVISMIIQFGAQRSVLFVSIIIQFEA